MGLSAAGSTIKSIQRGSITLPANTTATATISSVNMAKAEVRYLGHNVAGGAAQVWVKLLNATTVQADNTGDGNAGTLQFEVTEWN